MLLSLHDICLHAILFAYCVYILFCLHSNLLSCGFFRVSMFTYYFIYIVLFVFLCLHIILNTLGFFSSFYVYILFCLQQLYFFRVSMFTYYFVYIVLCLHRFFSCFYVCILFCLHCSFLALFFSCFYVYILFYLHCFVRVSIVYNVISLYVFLVFLCLHIILFTL